MNISCHPFGKSDFKPFTITVSCFTITSHDFHYLSVMLDDMDGVHHHYHAKWFQMIDDYIILEFYDSELKKVFNELY